ncbi:hypothetical protein [Salinicoccus roseus]|uniref:hypothetical protein n=1 Tax=Salinicoccus roseus TaxID=45670 RepID=UPI0015CC4824|nr:hypothetical protein [Salinicoccus roseus]
MMHYLPIIWFGSMLSLIVLDIISAPAFIVISVLSLFIALMIYCDDGVMQREHDTHY